MSFTRCLGKWVGTLSWKHLVHFVINQDTDDATRLQVYRHAEDLRGPGLELIGPQVDPEWAPDAGTRVIVEFIEGAPKTKIEAVNFGMEGRAFDILVNASDDMWPEVDGYDDVIAQEMERHWPALDGALNFWDGSPGDRDLCTLSVMGQGLFQRFGYIYHPAYVSLYADDEYTQACRRIRRMADPEGWRPGERVLVRHKHPALNGGKSTYDALMKRNEGFYDVDLKTFNDRKARNFDLPAVAQGPLSGPAVLVAPSEEPQGLQCEPCATRCGLAADVEYPDLRSGVPAGDRRRPIACPERAAPGARAPRGCGDSLPGGRRRTHGWGQTQRAAGQGGEGMAVLF